MLCPSCGLTNPDEMTFCGGCTARLDAPAEHAPDQSELDADFVGRRRELGELLSALDGAFSGKGRIVMLVGEPGIGKTRTAQELAKVAEGRGAQVLWARCYEGEGAPPYWPWVQAIRSLVQSSDMEQLRDEIGPGAADIAEIVPEILSKIPDVEPPSPLEAEEARFRLFSSVATFLKNASRSRPIVLVFDDLHWADKSSLLLLEFVAREISESNLLFVGTYRDVDVTRRHPLSQSLGNLIRERSFQSIRIGGLSGDEVRRLADAAGGAGLESFQIEAVHKRTGGNPLFVREILKMIELEVPGDKSALELRIPTGVRDVIGRRLDRLSEECNEFLTIASMIGREFDFKLLNSVTDLTEAQLLRVIDEALDASVLEESSEGVERYQFNHALIQQTLMEELSTSRKVRLHALIGEALEQLYGSDVGDHVDELVHHFDQAQTVLGSEKLIRYSLLAGERESPGPAGQGAGAGRAPHRSPLPAP